MPRTPILLISPGFFQTLKAAGPPQGKLRVVLGADAAPIKRLQVSRGWSCGWCGWNAPSQLHLQVCDIFVLHTSSTSLSSSLLPALFLLSTIPSCSYISPRLIVLGGFYLLTACAPSRHVVLQVIDICSPESRAPNETRQQPCRLPLVHYSTAMCQ